MLPTRTASRPMFNRGLIAETGLIPAGYKLIKDTFPFKVLDKKVVVEDINGTPQPVTRVTGLFQLGDKENANGRYYPTNDVLTPAVKQIQEDIGSRAVIGEFDHPCVTSDDFRVLTTTGWKEFRDIKIGDFVWSRLNGKMVKSRVNAITDEPYDGTAYHICGKNINIDFTPGHRFLFENRPDNGDCSQIYATVADISKNRKHYSHCRVPQTAKYDTTPSTTITLNKCDNLVKDTKYYRADCGGSVTEKLVVDARLFASFIGLYLAEGNIKSNTITISQKNEAGKALIRQLLGELCFNFTEVERGFNIVDKRLADYLRDFGDDKYTKYIPQSIKDLDSDCLESLIFWFAVGDGRMLVADHNNTYKSCKSLLSENGGSSTQLSLDIGVYSRIAVFTTSKRLIQDLHECVVKTGRSGKRSEIVTRDDYVFAGHKIEAQNKNVLYQLHISRRKGFNLDSRFTSIESFHHTGRIFCLSVDHGNFYIEHKGLSFWTGNSDAKIHLDRASHLITKIWMEGKKVYGQAEILHLLPCGAMLRGLFEHKVRVGISSRGVGDMEVHEQNGHEVYRVMPGYAFVTWDAVAEPSVSGAILNITEGLNRRLKPIRTESKNFSPDVYQNLLVKEINRFFDL